MMNSEQKHTDFSLYTFEEFLQNDFFISSMNHPTEETQKFWDEFEQMNPSNIDEYIAAKRYLEVFQKRKKKYFQMRKRMIYGLVYRQPI